MELLSKQSKQAFEEAIRYIPGGVNSPVRSFKSIGRSPLFFEKASGSVLTDVDGNDYIDMCNSWGVTLLGHAHPEVTEAVIARVQKGTTFGAPTPEETLLAKKVIDMVPAIDMVRFVSSGTEAVMSAVRVARGFTGRTLLVKFDGCYHGHADHLLVDAGSGVAETGEHLTPGVPREFAQCTVSLPFNDPKAVKALFETRGEEIAAVIVEPVPANMGVVPAGSGFLQLLRDLTTQYGALLIFDEVITGFRMSRGGAGQYFGITPDLVTLGKIIGGGFPVGAFGGRRDVMEVLAPLGPVYQAGTLSGNPVAMEAGYHTLRLLDQPGVYEDLARKAESFLGKLRAIVDRYPVTLNSVGPMFTLFFHKKNPTNFEEVKGCDFENFAWFYRSLLKEGVYFSPSQYEANFVNVAHTEHQLRLVLIGVQRALSYVYGYVDNM
ncbi:glutamate-1-semialdehyde 2,1-aminomutase [Breznakibacter xylanolyticus]|uniref:Glutamate-1-semialdehyde 2,1-aminomutase n=1 Tax=Breznakibacter xylanolyticus TaxID=990 RepID=A0A2W7MRJ6_9BACT|nr:glutamate-1-semialdehyde 2,1-aminomutase [Breznakibacter xylanolyticus]MBN2744151.1 glutamate-1-semialdehyde 2,1-aminomutase [Marinilabiliaceae bacterium]PZX10520.1 glutamate-1-semialdehyde 2,1-aminomutase [Breznakibacter xylanolyticus]